MKHFLLLLTLGTLGFAGCKKDEISLESGPTCISEKAQQFAQGNGCKTSTLTIGASVKEYRFQDRLVYVFDPGNCGADEASQVLDASCKTIGFLGGFGGNITVNGDSFEKAELKRTIWQQ